MFDYEREKQKLERDLETGTIKQSQYEFGLSELNKLKEKMEDLKIQYNAGHIDGLKYNTIEHELMVAYDAALTNKMRQGRMLKKKIKHIFYGITAILCVIAAIIVVIIARENYKHRAISDIPEPVQVSTTGSKSLEIGVTKAQLSYVAGYTVEGVIISTEKFETDDAYDEVSPYAIGLAWGYAAENNDKITWARASRNVIAKEFGGLDRIKIQSSAAMNEIIPADDTVKAAAEKYYLGDRIKITGYLVNVTAENGLGKIVRYTSTTRGDTSNNFTGSPSANEIIYATEITQVYD
ncbi:hypothetical protein IKP94_04795 [Candidatus Saccharibacteria bacterium]|nr:hypothetical protein [Candidatus Saccharibacteria bacterium]